MTWTFENVILLLVVLLLVAAVPVLRWYFHARWLWATAPVWGAIALIVALAVYALVSILRQGIDVA